MVLGYAAYAVGSYLLGCVNPSYMLARRRGFDIRKRGTNNAGATNAMFALGFWKGVLVLLFDVGKAYAAVIFASMIWKEALWPQAAAGICCMLGHIFPVFMRFRGGKGTACFAGIVLAMSPVLFLPMAVVAFLIGVVFNRASVLPIAAALSYPLIYWLVRRDLPSTLVLIAIPVLLIWAHRKNFAKLKNNAETPFRKVVFGRNLDDCIERQDKGEEAEESGTEAR
jgi:glycerol-3-phosphate acyltransferase PlsY